MASSVSWNCYNCAASYSSLFDLVSHVRGAHSSEAVLNFICGVQGCSRTFKKTNTWYKHVVKHHRSEYMSSGSSSSDSDSEEGCTHDIEDGDVQPFSEDENMDPPSTAGALEDDDSLHTHHYVSFFNKDVIAGKLFKIREHHMVSYAAVGEVVDLVQIACDNILSEALSAIWQSGEASGMDMSSDFFQNLPKTFENLNHPLASIETAYKQYSYIAKNLPYVVSKDSYILSVFLKFFISRNLCGVKSGHTLELLGETR